MIKRERAEGRAEERAEAIMELLEDSGEVIKIKMVLLI